MPDQSSFLTLETFEAHGLQLKSLVADLEYDFPPFNPTPTMSDREIMWRAGQRSVVEYILRKTNGKEEKGQ